MSSNNTPTRLYYTTYLYAEYILRNIESKKPDLLKWIIEIKKIIQENFDMFSADILMDAVLENECFNRSSEYDCDLFSGAILKRLSSRKEYDNELFLECVESLNNLLMEEFSSQFQEIIKYSLEEGIYITHLDSFRKEEYPLTISNSLPKIFYLRHIFFKSEKSFWKNNKYIDYIGPEYSECNEDSIKQEWIQRKHKVGLIDEEVYLQEENLKRKLSIYIPIFDDDFDIDIYLSQIRSIIIAYKLDNLEQIFDDYKKYKDFINLFFGKDIHRVSKDEMKNKILGLLIWDEKRSPKSMPEIIESISRKYNSTLFADNEHTNPICTNPICTKKCAADYACDKLAWKLYNVADKSIKNKKITTSKE